MKIALLGSGSIVKNIIESILKEGHEIVAIGTNKNCSITEWRLNELGINPIIVDDYTELSVLTLDLVLMISYAPLIKEEFLKKMNFINIHYALLPRFRGFHGFIWSMINDEKYMGYTVHKVDTGIDSGPIYFQKRVKVNDELDINDVRKLIEEDLVKRIGKYLNEIDNGKIPTPQNNNEAIYVTKRYPEDGEIDWNWSSRRIFNFIRALTPPATPGAFSFINGKKVIISKARLLNVPTYFSDVGKVVNIDFFNETIYVKCQDKIIEICEIIVDGKKQQPVELINVVGKKFKNSKINNSIF